MIRLPIIHYILPGLFHIFFLCWLVFINPIIQGGLKFQGSAHVKVTILANIRSQFFFLCVDLHVVYAFHKHFNLLWSQLVRLYQFLLFFLLIYRKKSIEHVWSVKLLHRSIDRHWELLKEMAVLLINDLLIILHLFNFTLLSLLNNIINILNKTKDIFILDFQHGHDALDVMIDIGKADVLLDVMCEFITLQTFNSLIPYCSFQFFTGLIFKHLEDHPKELANAADAFITKEGRRINAFFLFSLVMVFDIAYLFLVKEEIAGTKSPHDMLKTYHLQGRYEFLFDGGRFFILCLYYRKINEVVQQQFLFFARNILLVGIPNAVLLKPSLVLAFNVQLLCNEIGFEPIFNADEIVRPVLVNMLLLFPPGQQGQHLLVLLHQPQHHLFVLLVVHYQYCFEEEVDAL